MNIEADSAIDHILTVEPMDPLDELIDFVEMGPPTEGKSADGGLQRVIRELIKYRLVTICMSPTLVGCLD